MKLLVYEWNSYLQYDLYAILKEKNISFDKLTWKFADKNVDELVVYESFEDALAKVDFYLRHEALRQEIANNGRRKVLEEHSLQRRLTKIFEVAGIAEM